jgi:hypothetical protein
MPDVFDMAAVARSLSVNACASRLRTAAALIEGCAGDGDGVRVLVSLIRAAVITADVARQLTITVGEGSRLDDGAR